MRPIVLVFMLNAAMPVAALAQPVAGPTFAALVAANDPATVPAISDSSRSAEQPTAIAESSSSPTSSEASLSSAQDSSVDFVWNPPGKLISVGTHRLHIDCVGKGPVTVLFEAGLGGSSLEWQNIQREVADRSVACTYDRGGYGWSEPASGRRNAMTLARETHLLLNNLNIRGPLILVGHSFGGFVIRELANLRDGAIVGLILVDASHEKQVLEFERIMPIANMPTGKSFVISPMSLPDGLDPLIGSKIQVFGRMRKTYHAVHAEMASFRESALQAAKLPRPVKYPIVVMRRGRDLFERDARAAQKTQLWQRLQTDLARLSESGRVEVATDSGHHVHLDEPRRLIEQIDILLEQFQRTL